MVDELASEIVEGGPGCSRACLWIRVIRPGLLRPQELLIHDPESHEMYGRLLAGDIAARMVLETGLLTIDREARMASVDGANVALTAIEWRLLLHLADRLGRFSPYRTIIGEVWGKEYIKTGGMHAASAHLSRLRGKLGPRACGLIETRKDFGLRLREWPIGEEAPPVFATNPRT